MALARPPPPGVVFPTQKAGLPVLLGQLAAADAGQRREAARKLSAHPASAPALASGLATEADATVRAVIFSSLGRMGGDAAVDALLALLRSPDAALRNAALETLASLPHEVVPRMASLLVDADSDVRLLAMSLLGRLPHAAVPHWLEPVLLGDPDANVVGAALDVAAEVAGPELNSALHAAVARFPADPFIAFAAGVVLKRTQTA